MIQAVALLRDSMRELKSRSLFWFALVISALVSLALFGGISFNEQGWRVLFFSTNESEMLRAGTEDARRFMMLIFSLYTQWWLSWGVMILAIISTASILPGFLAGGSIDMSLSKPIRRSTLMAWKIVGAVLFVALQAGLGVILAYLLLGLKEGIWIHTMLWAIPLLTLQFIYLYAISALVAVFTRSTLASLLVTALAWVFFGVVQFASNTVDTNIAQLNAMIDDFDERIVAVQERAAEQDRELTLGEQSRIEWYRDRQEPYRQQIGWYEPYQQPFSTVELFVPKTGDIRDIIADMTNATMMGELMERSEFINEMRPQDMSEEEWQAAIRAGNKADAEVRNVDRLRSIGSSLIFTFVVLAVAFFRFVRRDF